MNAATTFLDADTLAMFAESVQRYGQDKYSFDTYRAASGEAPGFSRRAWSEYAAMGWLGAALPLDQGGFGGDVRAVSVLMRYAGEHLALEPLFATAVVGARLLALSGADGARARLDAVASGTSLLALAHVEAAGDAFDGAVQTSCRDGRLYGTKRVVLHGDVADELIVSVRDQAGAGAGVDSVHGADVAPVPLSLYTVDMGQAGVRKTSYRLLDGRGAASIEFDGAAATLLGHRGAARRVLELALLDARLALCAESHGAMRALNRLTLAYLKERRQFGRPIGMNQALQHRMVELHMLEQEVAAVIAAAQRASAIDGSRHERAVMGAVAYAITAGRQISHEAVQMHGGIGTTDELAVGHYFKRIMVNNRLLGDRDAHVDAFARADAVSSARAE